MNNPVCTATTAKRLANRTAGGAALGPSVGNVKELREKLKAAEKRLGVECNQWRRRKKV